VKKLELQAEHLQQNNLEALLAPLAPDTASAGRAGMENNLERYLLLAGLKTDASLQQLLNSLLETFACESR
jgi:hypothetical protein